MNVDTLYINLYHMHAKVVCDQLLDLSEPLETLPTSVLTTTTNIEGVG